MHGYLANKQSFNYQTEYFRKYYKVFAPDLKGFGENTGMEYPYSLDDYCQEVSEYIAKNGIYNCDVIAHSFGGRIAIKLASINSGLFNKMVLTGCAGLKPKKTLKKTFRKFAFNTLKHFYKKEKLERFYSSDYLALDSVMKQSFIKIVNEYLDDRLKYIKNKAFIVFGENDGETPLYMAKKLHKKIADSKLLIIKNAGHFAFIDNPNIFNTEVREFLLS